MVKEINNDTIRIAVKMYPMCKNKALEEYGYINDWDTSKVTDMSKLFKCAYGFNYDISIWDTSNVTNMSELFRCATSFNQDISKWDTSKVTNMNCMFREAHRFNQDISNSSNVTTMSYMFCYASSFNQDVSNWDTSKVIYMNTMFYNAPGFNCDVSKWNLDSAVDARCMILHTRLNERLNGETCFNKKAMKKLFLYERRKNFLMFLVKTRFIPYQGACVLNRYHKIFSREDIYRTIMSFV